MLRGLITVLLGVFIFLIVIWGLEYSRMENNIQEKENMQVHPKIFKGSIKEVGYIVDFRIKREFSFNFFEVLSNHSVFNEKKIIWWIKIPSSKKVYACDYEGGYLGYVKNEEVELIHIDEENVDPDGEYDGYIIGLHDKSKEKATLVWAVDNEDYAQDIVDFKNTKKLK